MINRYLHCITQVGSGFLFTVKSGFGQFQSGSATLAMYIINLCKIKKKKKKKKTFPLQPAESEERAEPDPGPGRDCRGLPPLQHPAPPSQPLRVPARQHRVQVNYMTMIINLSSEMSCRKMVYL